MILCRFWRSFRHVGSSAGGAGCKAVDAGYSQQQLNRQASKHAVVTKTAPISQHNFHPPLWAVGPLIGTVTGGIASFVLVR
jgi:hypothetical protein